MTRNRSLIRVAWIFSLGLGYLFTLGTLSGCDSGGGGGADTGSVELTEAKKAELAAQRKQTEDAYKDYAKTKKK